MNANVQYALTPGKTSIEDATTEKAIVQMREYANRVSLAFEVKTTAATGALTAIWTDPDEVPRSTAALYDVWVVGASSDGTVYAAYHGWALFFRDASAAAVQLGATQNVNQIESAAGLDFAITVGADSKVVVSVNDGGLGTVSWKCWVELRSR